MPSACNRQSLYPVNYNANTLFYCNLYSIWINSSIPHQTELLSIYSVITDIIKCILLARGVQNRIAFNTSLENIFEFSDSNKHQSAVIIQILVHKIWLMSLDVYWLLQCKYFPCTMKINWFGPILLHTFHPSIVDTAQCELEGVFQLDWTIQNTRVFLRNVRRLC